MVVAVGTRLVRAASIADAAFDGVILVSSCPKALELNQHTQGLASILQTYEQLHKGAANTASLVAVAKDLVPSGRLIFAGTGRSCATDLFIAITMMSVAIRMLPLARAREEALNEKNPHLMTLATLTGHEILSHGYYAAIMDNGPAKKSGWARKIQEVGDEYGQPIEISRLQPEIGSAQTMKKEQRLKQNKLFTRDHCLLCCI